MTFIFHEQDGGMVAFATDSWGLLYETDKKSNVTYDKICFGGLPLHFQNTHKMVVLTEEVPIGEMCRNHSLHLRFAEEKKINDETVTLYKVDEKQYDYSHSKRAYKTIEDFVDENYKMPNVIDNQEEFDALYKSVIELLHKWEEVR